MSADDSQLSRGCTSHLEGAWPPSSYANANKSICVCVYVCTKIYYTDTLFPYSEMKVKFRLRFINKKSKNGSVSILRFLWINLMYNTKFPTTIREQQTV